MLRYLFRLSLAFVIVVGLLTVAAFFLPRQHTIERTVTIAAPPAAVFPLVGDLAQWKQWGLWFERDPAMTATFSPATTGAGAWTVWETGGRADRAVRVEVVESVSPDLLRYRKSFLNPPLTLEGTVKFVAADGGRQTAVIWRDEVRLGWSPVVRWFGLMLDRLRGAEVDRSLAKLKAVAETKR